MVLRAPAYTTPIMVLVLLWGVPTLAQDLALTKDSERGFRQLMRAAQAGEMGDDVTYANIGIEPHRVRIELVRPGQEGKFLFLTRTNAARGVSKYFDIEIGDAATADDARRVAGILDAAFAEDPFEAAFGFFGTHTASYFPPLTAAWQEGGWSEVWWALEGRLAAPVGRTHAAIVGTAVAIAALGMLILLWVSEP